MTSADEVLERVKALGLCLDDVVVTGVSVGLPRPENGGTVQQFCTPADFERIFDGVCGISCLPDEDVNLMLEKNVVQMRRGPDGKREKYALSLPEEVIQIAGRIPSFDLVEQFGLPEALIPALDVTFKMAIAAGLEALRSAGIPLERSAGKLLLPEELRDSTGVIFAASFPVLDSLIEEVSRHLDYKHEKQSIREKLDVIRRVSKELEGKVVGGSQMLNEELAKLEQDSDALQYEFNRKLLFQILVMANSQLAEIIGARGPNVDMNAACASSAMGIAVAEDWIRTGRARRVIVVAADDVTSRNMLQYVGTGFLALGAASTKPHPKLAALPFSRNRNGLILGSGAVGLILEAESEAQRRSATVMGRILGTRVVNSAYHGSAIDVKHVTKELGTLLDQVERVHGVSRDQIATEGLYVSHETFTCANGGCAAVEAGALRESFGELASEMLIANTKAYTGHSMGAGIEDAVAVMSLYKGKIPPIPVPDELDSRLGKLNLAQGGSHDRSYALRFAAGFGSQCVYVVYSKT